MCGTEQKRRIKCVEKELAYLCQLFVEPEEYPRIFPSAIQEQKIEFAALGPCWAVEQKEKGDQIPDTIWLFGITGRR